MARITIRDLDDDVKTRLRVRAARNGRSTEKKIRQILLDAVEGKPCSRNLAEAVRALMTPLGGVELELPPRGRAREPTSFNRGRGHVRGARR